MSIIGNEIAGIVASHNGVHKLPFVFILMTILSLILGIALGKISSRECLF